MRRAKWCMIAFLLLGCNGSPEMSVTEPEGENTAFVPPSTDLEPLARTNPIGFLEHCRDQTARKYQSMRGTLLMHERIKGKQESPEVVHFSFREKPFSVRMEWVKGAKLANKTLYVEGENDGNLVGQPAGWRAYFAPLVYRRPDSDDARSSSRIPITRFGMQLGIESTLTAWRAARERKALHVSFNGLKSKPELGDRKVWELQRTDYGTAEDDGILKGTFYVDPVTLLQVGIVLHGADDQLIGSYFFRDLELNPTFDEDTFTVAGLKKK